MRVEYIEEEMMRGLELGFNRLGIEKLWYVRYHDWRDFCYFFIDPRHQEIFNKEDALVWFRLFYIPIDFPEFNGRWYFILPIAYWIKFKRLVRKIWFAPAALFHRKGYLHVAPGAHPALLWFIHLRPWKMRQDDDKDSV